MPRPSLTSGISRCADGEGDNVVNMRHGLPSQVRRREGLCLVQYAEVGNQQPQRRVIGGDRPPIRAFEIGNQRREQAHRYAQQVHRVLIGPAEGRRLGPGKDGRFAAPHAQRAAEMMNLIAGGEPGDHDDIVVFAGDSGEHGMSVQRTKPNTETA